MDYFDTTYSGGMATEAEGGEGKGSETEIGDGGTVVQLSVAGIVGGRDQVEGVARGGTEEEDGRRTAIARIQEVGRTHGQDQGATVVERQQQSTTAHPTARQCGG